MNPRAFCRESGYELAIALTYSFDPVFFENIVLHDLRAGGSGTVVVVGDPHEISAALENKGRNLEYLGRRYMLSSATHDRGAFHPKLVMRFGDKDGMVLISSGNLTSGGWGGNRELATSWKIGPEHDDPGTWIRPLLRSISAWCCGEHEKSVIERALSLTWVDSLPAATPDLEPPILFSQGNLPLATQLAARWSGRKFSKLTILTGSSDRQGAFIKWAHDRFGIEKVVVAGTVASLSFGPHELAKLPVEVTILPVEGDLLHAKFYWFEGPQGSSAVFGSANCSAAAWLLPPDKGGNVETIVCFDDAKHDDFSDALAVVTGTAITPELALDSVANSEDEDELQGSDEIPYRLTSLNWNARYAIATLCLSPLPPIDAQVTLVLDGVAAEARRIDDSDQSYFQTHYDDDFRDGTLFGYARITTAKGCEESTRRWVDCIVDLDQARSAVRTVEPLLGLEENRAPNEQRKLIGAIQLVIEALFSDAANFPDPSASPSTAQGKTDKSDEPAEPLDPVKVLCNLSEIEDEEANHGSRRIHPNKALSLSGILRLLFSGNRQNHEPPSEPSNNGGPDDEKKPLDHSDSRNLDHGKVEERNSQRLADQIATFFSRLEGDEFGQKCSAAQFVQAVAFPLAVAELGRQHAWVRPQQAEKWALRLFHILFRRNAGKTGLLHEVMERYQKQDKADVFAGAVSDGALWAALVATVANSHWEGLAAGFEKALAVRELFREPILLRASDSFLLHRYSLALRASEATKVLRKYAPDIVLALEALEIEVSQAWQAEALKGMVEPSTVHEGDLLWRPNVGWAFGLGPSEYPERVSVRLKGKDTEVMKGFYLNVSRLGESNSRISQLIQRIDLALSSIDAGGGQGPLIDAILCN